MNISGKCPFIGSPPTKVLSTRTGEPIIYVSLMAISPFWVKWRNRFRFWLPVAGMCYLGAPLVELELIPLQSWIEVLIVPWVLFPLVYMIFFFLFSKTVKVIFASDKVSIVKGGRRVSFDRSLPHRFVCLEHDKAQKEADRGVLPKKRVYAKSRILAFMYYGQRLDVLDIYGFKAARRFLDRCQACDAWMEATNKHGNGFATAPYEDFSSQAGNLPAKK